MTVAVPWSTLRENPRTLRETAVGEHLGAIESSSATSDKDTEKKTSFVWDMSDFGKRMAFGGIVGGITGITFGANARPPLQASRRWSQDSGHPAQVDGHRAIRTDKMGKFPTTDLKIKEFMRLTALSGTVFTGFFCGYQGIKYGAKLVRKEDDFFNVLIASAVSMTPMVPFPLLRARFPYAVILVGMDTLNNHVL